MLCLKSSAEHLASETLFCQTQKRHLIMALINAGTLFSEHYFQQQREYKVLAVKNMFSVTF